MMIIDDWLEDRIYEHRFNELESSDAAEFAMLAGIIRAQAIAAGYRIEVLESACGGDIPAYLLAQHTAMVQRLRKPQPAMA
jgi:hypothetical protein